MKSLAIIKDRDFGPKTPDIDTSGFAYREAARAIVMDGRKIALLKVQEHGYYKLPGGGIESDEDQHMALNREVLEEIGCHIKVRSEVGQIIEFREQWGLKQVSFCFVADKVGGALPPTFTDEEIASGFEIVWAKDLSDALELVSTSPGDGYESPFIKKRDSLFLSTARGE